jgi:hypothetical protein
MPFPKKEDEREKSAELIAAGELNDCEIALEVGVDRRSIYVWRDDPEFNARVDFHRAKIVKAIDRRAISRIESRVSRLNRDWLKLQRIINERSLDPKMETIPGGKTGLILRKYKAVGAKIFREFEVDVATLAELRATEKQAAQELNQWGEKTEASGLGEIHDLAEAYEDADDQNKPPGDSEGNRLLPEAEQPPQRGE